MVFNSETSEATGGKGVIAAGPPCARCTKAMSTQTSAVHMYEPLGKSRK